MRKSGLLASTVLLTGLASNILAFEPAAWKYQGQMVIEDGPSEYGKLLVTPEIYNAARVDLGDIRLIGDAGEQIPYVVAKPKDVTKRLRYEPTIINRSTNPQGASTVTLDFGQLQMKNSIEVQTGGSNFRRAVKVEGSNNNIQFFAMVQRAYVFAVGPGRRFQQIDLPANDYRYLRITVEPMDTEEQTVTIRQVKALRLEKTYAQRQFRKMTLLEHREDRKNRSSIYIYDLTYCRLPIIELKLGVAGDSFYRYVTVEGRNAPMRRVRIHSEDNRARFKEVEVKWERILTDTIYRYTTSDGQERERLVLRVPSERAQRYLKITINNYDDEPVAVTSARAGMIAHQIVFAARDNRTATLYMGSPSERKPSYDLRYRLTRPLQVEARTAKLSDLADNPLFGQAEVKQVPWSEEHKVLLLIIMGVAVLVLGRFIMKSLKSIQKEQTQR